MTGELVVDLWGGLADRASARPWRGDSLQLVFSGTKGLVATCVLLLVERGALDLDEPVGTYWPEFSAAGKEAVRVADLVSHRARLPALERPVAVEEALDDRRMAALLAGQAPNADPRAASAYHPITFGWLVGELVRRVDGRSVGRFFREEVAQPLGLELWIGLPADLEPRVTTIEPLPAVGADEGDALERAVWANPPLWEPDAFAFNRRDVHACELPAVNAIGTARSLARLYGCLAQGGTLDGVRLLAPETIELGRHVLSARRDELGGVDVAFGSASGCPPRAREYGPVDGGFGHTGAGGSVHGAWPDRRVGFSYAMNRMLARDVDGRAPALLAALAAATDRPA